MGTMDHQNQFLRQALGHHPSGQGQWSIRSKGGRHHGSPQHEPPHVAAPLEVFIGRVPGTPRKKITNQQRTPNEEQNDQAIQKRKGL